MHSGTFTIINMLGAVSLLLWGMHMVRSGMERALGSDLRQLLHRSMSNRFSAMGTGLVATLVLQSSTATAIIVSGFASKGLIETAPALATMLGADIGTALVSQVFSFDLRWLAPLLLLVGVSSHKLASRSLFRQAFGRGFIGVALVLIALAWLRDTAGTLGSSSAFSGILSATIGDPFAAVLIAAIFTWFAHSSLVTVLTVGAFAQLGVIENASVIPLVIGANLGGAIPPLVATWVMGSEGRRVTVGNAVFKACGSVAAISALPLIVSHFSSYTDGGRIAVDFHVMFNAALAGTFIFLINPIARVMSKLIETLHTDYDPAEPKYLDKSLVDRPVLALTAAAREAMRMAKVVERMFARSLNAIMNDDGEPNNEIKELDDQVDGLYRDIKFFICDVMRGDLRPDESQKSAECLSFILNLENIGDIVENLADLGRKRQKIKGRFSDDGVIEIADLHESVSQNLSLAISAYMSGDAEIAEYIVANKSEIRHKGMVAADAHIDRLRRRKTESIETSAIHLDILRDLQRINDHIVAIAISVGERIDNINYPSDAQPSRIRYSDMEPISNGR